MGEQVEAIFQALNNYYSSKKMEKIKADAKSMAKGNECDPDKVQEQKGIMKEFLLEALSLNTFAQIVAEVK